MKFFKKIGLAASVVAAAGALSASAGVQDYFDPVGKNASFFDTGLVYGFVFNDKNADGRRGAGERGQANVTVYLDTNDNGILDTGETSTKTRNGGFYFFFGLAEGDYVVRQALPFGWRNISGGEGESLSSRVLQKPQTAGGDVTAQIIGGDEVGIEEYPFMVALGFEDPEFGVFQFCGGVLITDRFVATAAHCLDPNLDEDVPFIKIIAGTNNVDDGSGFILDVKSIQLHPNFIPFPDDFPTEPVSVEAGFDIAVIELAEPIDLKASGLQSVSMIGRGNAALANDGVLATTVGWGASDIDSTLLQDVHVPIFDTQQCEILLENQFDIANFNTQICAGAPEGGIDACSGDSGGPLLVRDFAKEKWRVAGFTSYGVGCALPNNPGVWSRASVLSAWAKSAAREESRAYRISLSAGEFSRASFGNQSTRFEPKLPIDPRWQLVNPIFSGDLDSGVAVDFRIIDESETPRSFNCAADLDGFGPLAENVFDCVAGTNNFSFPEVSAGVFLPSFAAQLDNTIFERSPAPLLLGDLEQNAISGELTVNDPLDFDYLDPDPEFNAEYYIDYFDLSGVVSDQARAIEVVSEDFTPFVALYDRDIRENDLTPFASVLDFFDNFGEFGELAQYVGFFDEEPNVIIGVSTLEELQTGSYTVTVINGGSAESIVLSGPDLEERRVIPQFSSSSSKFPARQLREEKRKAFKTRPVR